MSSAEAERERQAERPAADRAAPRWRFLISPRWLGWHALALVLVCGMLALGWWQYRRAMEGNALSWAYTFEWPIFAIFGVVFWAKTIRDEFSPPGTDAVPDRADLTVGAAPGSGDGGAGLPGASGPDAAGPDAAGPDGAGPDGAGPGGNEAEDKDLAAYNAYLARLQEQVKGHGRWHGLR